MQLWPPATSLFGNEQETAGSQQPETALLAGGADLRLCGPRFFRRWHLRWEIPVPRSGRHRQANLRAAHRNHGGLMRYTPSVKRRARKPGLASGCPALWRSTCGVPPLTIHPLPINLCERIVLVMGQETSRIEKSTATPVYGGCRGDGTGNLCVRQRQQVAATTPRPD